VYCCVVLLLLILLVKKNWLTWPLKRSVVIVLALLYLIEVVVVPFDVLCVIFIGQYCSRCASQWLAWVSAAFAKKARKRAVAWEAEETSLCVLAGVSCVHQKKKKKKTLVFDCWYCCWHFVVYFFFDWWLCIYLLCYALYCVIFWLLLICVALCLGILWLFMHGLCYTYYYDWRMKKWRE